MSFSTGNSSQTSEINVTPLIDVLLVLLIIFMVLVPLTPIGLRALVPQPAPKSPVPPPKPPDTIVLQVHSGLNGGAPSYSINEQPVAKPDIVRRLTAIFATRQERLMFVKGDPDIEYKWVAEVIDIAHGSGIDKVGLMPFKDLAQ